MTISGLCSRSRLHHLLQYGDISRTESSDLLAVLDQLDTDTLANSGVGLLGLDTDLLEDDALGVGGTSERRGLEGGAEGSLLESVIGPSLLATGGAQLARGVETSRLTLSHFELLQINKGLSVIAIARYSFDRV